MKSLLIVLVFVAGTAFAEETPPVNYCHDKKVSAEWEKMLADTPEDPLIIKLYGLRVGLCQMIDEGKVSLEQGIEVWNQEHAKSVNQRAREDADRKQDVTL